MKKTGVRQMIFGILGSLACGVSVMGCYPLVPAYFTALYLEQVNGVVLLAFMYIGMTLFMPLTAAVKYGVTLIVMIGAVKLIEWANEGCPAFLAGVMAGNGIRSKFPPAGKWKDTGPSITDMTSRKPTNPDCIKQHSKYRRHGKANVYLSFSKVP